MPGCYIKCLLTAHSPAVNLSCYQDFAKSCANKMTSCQASNAMILTGRIGDKIMYGHDRDLSTDGDFKKGRMDGT